MRWTGSESRAGRRAGHLLLPGLLPLPGKSWKNGLRPVLTKVLKKKRKVWSPTDCCHLLLGNLLVMVTIASAKRIADGGEGQRSGHRAEKSWIQQRESGKQGLGKSLWI